jgi:hypothetical protein
MKSLVAAVLITSVLATGTAMAEHELGQPKKAEVVQGTHLSWHEFRHELGNYTQVQANMTHEGVVFLTGHADSALEKSQVDKLARRIRGAVKVSNQISTD